MQKMKEKYRKMIINQIKKKKKLIIKLNNYNQSLITKWVSNQNSVNVISILIKKNRIF